MVRSCRTFKCSVREVEMDNQFFEEQCLILPQMTNFRRFQTFADDNFKFHENGRMFFRLEENTVGRGEIAHYEQFLLFPQCFQKTCTVDM